MSNSSELEKRIVENYNHDEKMMILIYAQWCVNWGLDPIVIYQNAYPSQNSHVLLKEIVELTLPKEEADPISFETLMTVLSGFGNDDLAFEANKEFENLNRDNLEDEL